VKGRLGAGASKKYGSPDDAWSPEGMLGLDYEHQFTERQKLVSSLEYYPEFESFSDFRTYLRVSYDWLVDAKMGLNLQFFLLDRYDNTPSFGTEKNDINYGLGLKWVF
jgi:hypothetical protein